MHNTKVAGKLRKRIGRFSGDLSRGLCKVAGRFVSEMVYGIQASESVLLTEVGRTLEETIHTTCRAHAGMSAQAGSYPSALSSGISA